MGVRCGGAIGLLCHVDSSFCLVCVCVWVWWKFDIQVTRPARQDKTRVWWDGAIGYLCCVDLRWYLPGEPK